MTKTSIPMFLILLAGPVLSVQAVDVLVQSRIKGAMMGAALGDAFARVARFHAGKKKISSFDDFSKEDWVTDSAGYWIGIGTENSLLSITLFKALLNGRRQNLGQKELLTSCARELHCLLCRRTRDPFYTARPFRTSTLERLQQVDQKRSCNKNDSSVSASPLVLMVPVGLVFSDDLDQVKKIADKIIQLTHTHSTVRAAGVALAVGIACLTNNLSQEETIKEMVGAARTFEERERAHGKKSAQEGDLFNRPLREYVVADLISYAAQQKGDVGLVKRRAVSHTSKPRLHGFCADEALAAAVHLMVRHDTFEDLLSEAVHMQGNSTLVSYIAGALKGAQVDFWGLRKEGYIDDLEMLEQINVLQGMCNDLYVLLTDYEPYDSQGISYKVTRSADSVQPLFNEIDDDDFIIRWNFQDLCDHMFDPWTLSWAHPTSFNEGGVRFDPKKVKTADIIFARNIELFMKEMHPQIEVPYILVTHGEFRDTCLEYQLTYLEDKKIIAWFSIHPTKQGHEKYYPIPLGMKQGGDYYKDPQKVNSFLKTLRQKPKSKMLYMNLSLEQNPERLACHKLFLDKPYCFSREKHLPFMDYLDEMADYKFALSPRGWGPDCYRTWEALLVGTIPIVRRCQFDQLQVRGANIADPGDAYTITSYQGSQLDTLYDGLPILIVDDWHELNEQFLKRRYKEITSKAYDLEKLYMDYWYKKISGIKRQYLMEHSQEAGEDRV